MSIAAWQSVTVPAPVQARRSPVRLRFILWLAATLVVVFAAVRWTSVLERVAFFHPGTTNYATPPGIEEVEFATPDGKTLHAWFMPAKNRPEGSGPAPAIIHCHGNEGDIAALHDHVREIRDHMENEVGGAMPAGEANAFIVEKLNRWHIRPSQIHRGEFVKMLGLMAELPEVEGRGMSGPAR